MVYLRSIRLAIYHRIGLAIAIILFSIGIARRVDGQSAFIQDEKPQEVAQVTPEPTQITAEVAPEIEKHQKTVQSTTKKITNRTYDCEQYSGLVEKYFPQKEVPTMMKVMQAESGCNTAAHNWADKHRTCLGSHGLFQVGCVHGESPTQLEDPEFNVKVAAQVWRSQGYKAWGVCITRKVNCGL